MSEIVEFVMGPVLGVLGILGMIYVQGQEIKPVSGQISFACFGNSVNLWLEN